MVVKLDKLNPLGGLLVQTQTGAKLADLERDLVVRLFKEHGALLFRGFAPSMEEFEDFTKRFADQFLFSPSHAPKYGRPETHAAAEGNEGIPLHTERAWAPAKPDIIYFYCLRPADQGGETILCDAVRLLQSLPDDCKARLQDLKLHFRLHIPKDALGRVMAGGQKSPLDRLRPGQTVSANMDGEVAIIDYIFPCIGTTKYQQQDALADYPFPYLTPVENGGIRHETISLALEGGAQFPADLFEQLQGAAKACTFGVQWEAQDLLMVDNTWYMHGRPPFPLSDGEVRRELATRLCYAEL